MLTLDGVRWGEFFISDVAEIISGHDIYEDERVSGSTPYIGASALNNGITHFVSNTNESQEAGCISVNRNGSVGYAFYHPYEALYSNDCRKLRPYHKSKYTAIFIATQITTQRGKYSYGYKMGTARLMRQKIFLPVDESGRPDYAFMERFMRGIEQRLIKSYVEQVSVRLRNTPPQKLLSLDGVTWGKFAIGDLFTVEIGKNIDGNKVDKHAGKIPYITRKESNNGLDGFIDNDTTLLNTSYPVITIGNETAEPFVQDFQFYTGTKVNILKPNTPLTRQALKFVAVSIKQHKDKYSYAFTINSARLKRQVIQLPITPSGIPDWHLMHSYMLSLESQHLSAVISHFTAKLNTGV